MITITVPLEFVLVRSSVTWQEVLFAIENQWLRPRDAIEIAIKRLAETSPPHPLECELACREPDEPVLETVRRLASTEPSQDDRGVTQKWMRLLLLWVYHRREHLENPLELVEIIWCSLGHPPEFDRFIRWMPAEDPVAAESRSVDENLRLLRLEWEHYMNELDQEMLANRRRPEV